MRSTTKLWLCIAITALTLGAIACSGSNDTNNVRQWGDWEVTTAPTCTEDGEETRTCELDPTYTETRPIPARCTWGEWQGAYLPTCIAGGAGTRVCAFCPEWEVNNNLPALGHDYIWAQITAPTCIAQGEETGICARAGCIDTINRPVAINPDAHGWEYKGGAVSPTCTEDGSGQRGCTLCPATEASGVYSALGHDPGNWMQTLAPTCVLAGVEAGTCTRDGCTHPATRIVPALGHAPGDWVQTTPPACTTLGAEAGTCTRGGCTHPETRIIAALGHDLSEWYTHSSGRQRKDCQRGGCDHWIDSVTSLIPGSEVTLTMRWMPATGTGGFRMGSPTAETGHRTDETRHTAVLTRGFYMGIYTVTQEQYAAVMAGNANGLNASPSGFSSNPAAGEEQARRPVETVSWYDALVFCNRLSMKQGLSPVYSLGGSTDPATWGNVPTSNNATWNAVTVNWDANGYRLPTEAEWEYACRAGAGTAYYTGDTANTAFNNAAWYDVNSGNMTREVGLKTPNAWGLYDMHGNVWEWCWDWFNANAYSGGTRTDPRSFSGTERVRRGGSWSNNAGTLRSARRGSDTPSLRGNARGFRVVLNQ